MSTEILLPEGRIVAGHPITMKQKLDDNKLPVMQKGTMVPVTEAYLGYAIAKRGEAHWNQTEWGANIWAEGQTAYPTMIQRPDFSWKIVDGDSTIPNKNNVVPSTKEGFPGHWIVNLTSQFGINCFHIGRYSPHEQIIDENEIKTGDYGQMFITCSGNAKNGVPAKTPGVYVNPKHFVLTRAGTLIVSDTGPSAAEVFAGLQATPNVAAPAPVVTPAYDLVQAPAPLAPVDREYNIQGTVYKESLLRANGWKDANFVGLTPIA